MELTSSTNEKAARVDPFKDNKNKWQPKIKWCRKFVLHEYIFIVNLLYMFICCQPMLCHS